MNEKDWMDVELFGCAGGFAEGWRRAGVEFDVVVEWDEDHCQSYEANLGHRPWQLDAAVLLEMLEQGWRPPKRVRILEADCPCTPWSRAGKRMGQDDPRDMLEGTCRIVALLQPDVFLLGNVPGLEDAPNLPVVQRTFGALSKHGYCVADFARLDSANYGVPQHRIRPFWFAHRKGPCIQWPTPTHGDPDECHNLTLPGITPLKPWVSCAQALGHLSPEELGRPIKLRRRSQNGVQQGSAPEQPARVVGTSNLSDGNVLIHPDAPRSGEKGRKRDRDRVPQGDRLNELDKPSATVTQNGGRARMGAASTLSLLPTEAPKNGRARNQGRVPQGYRTFGSMVDDDGEPVGAYDFTKPLPDEDEVAYVIGADEQTYILENKRHACATQDAPAPTMGAKQRGQGANVLVTNDKHRVNDGDEPSHTIRGGGEGHSAPQVIVVTDSHPASGHDDPSNTIRATSGGGSNRAVEWPWPRPATTVQSDPRLAPIGHHGPSFMSDADAVVISERAAAILQGFPEYLVCSCGKSVRTPVTGPKDGDPCATCGDPYKIETWTFVGSSKKQRWSALGMAMPPPIAHAVATSVVEQLKRTEEDPDR